MDDPVVSVSSAAELLAAVGAGGARRIVVRGAIRDIPSLRLAPGQQIVGDSDAATLMFVAGSDGLQLTAHNRVERLRLVAAPERRALFNDTIVADLGQLALRQVTTTGQVQILARGQVRRGHVFVEGLEIVDADTRERSERPHGYGVSVLQGAFTLWNLQPDEAAVLTADLVGISAGCEGRPVRGSGIFVGGAAERGGRVEISRLHTAAVCCDGGIPTGTHDLISGGVFVVYGAHVAEVRTCRPVVTYGTNDMVLDNWGTVERWVATGALRSYGPSGIGVVNFGAIRELQIAAPIETFGLGARGFNVYSGSIEHAEFDRIITHADAGVGVQISRPLGRLIVHHSIETHGGVGDTLVQGVITRLAADGLSVQPGGTVREVRIGGGIRSSGDGVASLHVQGVIEQLTVAGEIRASGHGSQAVQVIDGTLPLDDLRVVADDGIAVELQGATLTAIRATTAHGSRGDVVVTADSLAHASVASAEALGASVGNAFTVGGPAVLRIVS